MSIDWGVVLPNIIASIFLAILIAIFIYHSVNQNRPVRYFLGTLILAFISTVLVAIAWIAFEEGSFGIQIMRSAYLTISGLQICVFFAFLENSQRVKMMTWRLTLCVAMFMVQGIGLWALVGFFKSYDPYDAYYTAFWLMAKVGFNALAIFVYGYCGIRVYYNMYMYTREKKSLFSLLTAIIMTLGYIASLITDVVDALQELTGAWSIMKIMADTLPIAGLFLLVIVYVVDIKFIYRLPFNHHFLMVSYKSGVPLFSIPFQTKGKSMELQEGIFSGMMSALNTVYNSILFSQEPIEEIRSEGITLFAENGKHISAIVASEQVSRVLYRGMRQFVNEFEAKFHNELDRMDQNRDSFAEGAEIFQRIFPFLRPRLKMP